jgi:hypothetical protein
VTLKSAHILDEDGNALDGEFVAGQLPSGNGTPGGDFYSYFWIRPLGGREGGEEQATEGPAEEAAGPASDGR